MSGSTAVFPTSRSPRSDLYHRAGRIAASSPTDAARLVGEVRPVASLTTAERDRMYALQAEYFMGVTRVGFEQDLAEKEWAILLTDAADRQVRGFSTLMRLRIDVEGRPVVAFFSGDTVVARAYWGETALPRLWAGHVFGLAATIRDARTYWFLISSGYKTYRFLPVFFRTFYPSCERPTPPSIQRVLDALGRAKFPTGYDERQGVVRLARAAPLRAGVAEITERRLRDPHVAFFLAANPGHAGGDELACLAEVTPANLTPAGRRMLGT